MSNPRHLILAVSIVVLGTALALLTLRGRSTTAVDPLGGFSGSLPGGPASQAAGLEGADLPAGPEAFPADSSSGESRRALPAAEASEPVELRVRLVTLEPAPEGVRAEPTPSPASSVAGCTVELRRLGGEATQAAPQARTSDDEGIVRFEDLPVGDYELNVRACASYRDWRGVVDLSRPRGGLRRLGDLAMLQVRLWPDQGRLAGRLVDADGLPVAGAQLALVSGKNNLSRRGSGAELLLGYCERTAADGGFELPRCAGVEQQELLICAGEGDLPVLHVRRLSAIEADGTGPIQLVLPRARLARLTVLDAAGLAASGRVCLQRDGAMLPPDCEERLEHFPGLDRQRGVRRGSGSLELPLVPGHYVLHFVPSDSSRSRSLFSFELTDPGPDAFEFRLQP